MIKAEIRAAGAVWRIIKIADYWRLMCNGSIVATFNSKGAAKAGLVVEKRRRAKS